jgi:steroid delta-isomerase-like uncharacterized protein
MAKERTGIMRRVFEEVWNQKKLDVIKETHSPDFVWHGPPTQGEHRGQEAYRQYVLGVIGPFPDMRFVIEDEILAGDREVIRWSETATHKGEFKGVTPTGKTATNSGISIVRLSGGKIVEEWVRWDVLDMMQQLGAVPTT